MKSRGILIAGTVAAGAASTGCSQLLGIDKTDNTGLTNTVELTRVSVGATVVPGPLDLAGLTATYLVPSGTSFEPVPADADVAAATWTAHLPEPTPVELTLPGMPQVPRQFALPNTALHVPFAVLEHPQPAPAPDGATITLTVPLNTAVVDGQTFQIYTVGSWTVLPLAVSPEEPPPDPMTPPGPPKPIGPVTYPFNTSTSLSGRLDALTAQDVFLVLRYAGDALTGYAVAEPFAQSDATTVNMSTLLDLSLSQSFDLKPPVGLVNRYGGVSPAVGSPTLSWTLVAAPGHSVAEPAGPVLRRGGFNADDVVGVTVQYGNPFAQDRDWKTLLSFTTEETRPYMPMGTTAQLTLRAGMSELFEPRDGVVNELELRAGLPMRIKLNNVQLVLDGQQTSVPNEPVEVTFTTDNTNATLYNLQVSEVVVSDDKTSVSTRMILDAASIEPRFELRPELFVVGHSYVLRAICTSGSYPGLETGDLVTRSLPLWQSFLDSGVFTVTP